MSNKYSPIFSERKGRLAVAVSIFIGAAISLASCNNSQERSEEVKLQHDGSEPVMFPNFVSVEFAGFGRSEVEIKSYRSGPMDRPAIEVKALDAALLEHVISSEGCANGQLEIDGKRLSGTHFKIFSEWRIEAAKPAENSQIEALLESAKR